jgi:hypothetical protein
MQHFYNDDNLNIFRLPVGWQYLVNNELGGTLDSTNFGIYNGLMQSCLDTGAYCIIDVSMGFFFSLFSLFCRTLLDWTWLVLASTYHFLYWAGINTVADSQLCSLERNHYWPGRSYQCPVCESLGTASHLLR